MEISPLVGLLLLGGGIAIIMGSLLHLKDTSYKRYKIAEPIILIGLITQILGIVLLFIAYHDLNSAINTINVNSLSPYIISPEMGLYLIFLAVLLGLISFCMEFYMQRKENTVLFQKD